MGAAMRVVRVAAGLVLVGAGWLALVIGAAGLVFGSHRSGDGAFVADLVPVHTDGGAVVAPDLAELLNGHGVGALLGDGRLSIAVRSDHPVEVLMLPARDLPRLLGTTDHTDIVRVGFAMGGPQPVQTVQRPGNPNGDTNPSGDANPGPQGTAANDATPIIPASTLVENGQTVTFDTPTQEPTAVVVRRVDGQPGLTVAFSAGLAPAAWGAVIAFALAAGGLCLVSGALLLLLRRATDPVLVDFNAPDEEPGPQWTPRRHAVLHRPYRPRGGRWRGDRWRKDRKSVVALRSATVESPYVHTAT
jgi:hypothetical protein